MGEQGNTPMQGTPNKGTLRMAGGGERNQEPVRVGKLPAAPDEAQFMKLMKKN